MRVRESLVAVQQGPVLLGSDDAPLDERAPENGAFHADKRRMESRRERNRAQRGSPVVAKGQCQTCRYSIAAPWSPGGVQLMFCELAQTSFVPTHGCDDYERAPGAEG